ncbi:MAG: hypothetical protein JO182_31135 [Acidobacteriaceae bacterium]|nr:hypothetical protein [Acidobacteriaceae bacterium]MBV9038981.1 hypothetical protein [Acidobacteriaceae bacterium]MBV9227456.1 hypothetical protein [Acidobacteriaceae bacterium]MBV9307700.1 hypothetical protein [Acidobacteriaceae bacterium]MBV9675270.1 hypothetical protein [Acidobacteriaceae bacterium]
MCKVWKVLPVLFLGLLCGCKSSDRGHYGTPSDPNEQQGNPNAKPEKSIKSVDNKEADGNKASKDPHTLTPDNTAGQPKKR